ncbi:hypothetical protein P618_200915 [Holospora obtusa F1]|uniref:Uncharacterized protein n=1 Tax=Holospora obtusa F1 TaxID=1399147 RepID=W6TD83_HOLOB|nr:hypothetical protein [Holospora obtusa]ETZ06913.1 hypothetical protein P618_200915 [Holospora obtusa F1]
MKRFTFFLKCFLSQRQKGFILWEIVIGLAVFGVIAGVGMKMWKIVDQGKFVRTCEHIQSIVTQLRHYRCIHGVLPEEHALSENALSKASHHVWSSLAQDHWIDGVGASMLRQDQVYPKNALGGGAGLIRSRLNERAGVWLVIAKETQEGLNGGVFTPKEAERLAHTWGDGTPNSGDFFAKEGEGFLEGSCVEQSKFSKNSQRSCVVYVFVAD